MKILKYFSLLTLTISVLSCQKDPMEEIRDGNWNNERNIISITMENQIGPATVIRDEESQTVTAFVDPDGLNFASVKISALELSYKAQSSIPVNGTLNFDNAEHTSQITVTSQTGKELVWKIVLRPYEWFYVKTWSIREERIFVRQEWGSDFNKGITEISPEASKELDNSIQIIKDGIRNNRPYGRIINNAGADGSYGAFKVGDVNLDPKIRILIPSGESTWEMDLATNEMYIQKDGVTSKAKVTKESFGIRLDYALPQNDRWNVRWDYGNYDNFWCWSYKYFIDLK